MNEDIIGRIRKRAELTQRRIDDELRKLCDSPESYDVALHVTDAFFRGLDFLCNFPLALNCYGQAVDMVELREQLETEAKKKFFLLTGRRYEHEVARDYAFRQTGPQT